MKLSELKQMIKEIDSFCKNRGYGDPEVIIFNHDGDQIEEYMSAGYEFSKEAITIN